MSSYLFVSYSSNSFIRFSMNTAHQGIILDVLPSGVPDWWAQTRITLQRTASYMQCIEALRFDPLRTFVRWWAQVDSNHRPRAYQARALTTWAMSPCKFFGVSRSLFTLILLRFSFAVLSRTRFVEVPLPDVSDWWRWWESNPWPPACRAGALPAELHPHFSWGWMTTVTQNWTTMRSILAYRSYSSLVCLFGFALLKLRCLSTPCSTSRSP